MKEEKGNKLKYGANYSEKGYRMKYDDSGKKYAQKNVVYQFYIELLDVSPKVWRRIQVPAWYNFWDLHVAVQDSMGWWDSHLHHFDIKAKHKRQAVHIGIPDFYGTGELQEVYPGWEIRMSAYFNDLGIEARYEYDYGDGWAHRVKLEGYMHREKGQRYPRLLDGAQACPPEDCGGPSGYTDLISVLADKNHPEHDSFSEWVGPEWKPDRFLPETHFFDNPHTRWVHAFLEK